MLPSTVSHGKTPRSWKTKIRRGSGPRTTSPSIRTSPLVGERKPAMVLSSVDLPQPEGPTMQRNSPFATSRLMSFSTGVLLPSRVNVMWMCCADSLVSNGVPDGFRERH